MAVETQTARTEVPLGKEQLLRQPEFGIVLHGYQPPREITLPEGKPFTMFPDINEEIYDQCYQRILVEPDGLPAGLVFSLYGTLREWMKREHSGDFEKMRQKIQSFNHPEYQVLGDPYLHVILPLLSEEDQDSLIKIGCQAFFEDFGFSPRGFWLPEAAVSSSVLEKLCQNGYEFVILQEKQLLSFESNPVFVSCKSGQMAIFSLNSSLSGSIAFNDDWTINGDSFLNSLQKDNPLIGMDMETCGHHKPGRDKFLQYVLRPEILACHQFSPFDISSRLANNNHSSTQIRELSSWTCPDDLGRWQGAPECNCDHPSENVKKEKQELFEKLNGYQERINQELDNIKTSWREDFIETFLAIRNPLFNGENFDLILNLIAPIIQDEEEKRFILAKIYGLIGLTSCGWFFGKEDSLERGIPRAMIPVVEQLINSTPEVEAG